jgi:hypothetical protein
MDVERIIDEIEWLERIFAAPDTRPLNPSDLSDANRRHSEMRAVQPLVSPLAAIVPDEAEEMPTPSLLRERCRPTAPQPAGGRFPRF